MPRRNRNKAKSSELATDIPLSLPDYGSLTFGQTLLDLIDEKKGVQVAKATNKVHVKIIERDIKIKPKHNETETGTGTETETDVYVDPMTPLGNAIVYAITLCGVCCTLDIIALKQYGQELEWAGPLGRLLRLGPAIFTLIYILHQPALKSLPILRQSFFLVMSIVAGCWIMYAGNVHGYYHVMSKVPPLGTLWVWALLEMNLTGCLLQLAVVLGYTWWNGFGNF